MNHEPIPVAPLPRAAALAALALALGCGSHRPAQEQGSTAATESPAPARAEAGAEHEWRSAYSYASGPESIGSPRFGGNLVGAADQTVELHLTIAIGPAPPGVPWFEWGVDGEDLGVQLSTADGVRGTLISPPPQGRLPSTDTVFHADYSFRFQEPVGDSEGWVAAIELKGETARLRW